MKVTIVNKKSNSYEDDFKGVETLIGDLRRSQRTQERLREIRESRLELRCHCTVPPARMFVRFTHDIFTIVNHPSEGTHDLSCPLHSEIHGYTERETVNAVDVKSEPIQNFMLHRQVTQSKSQGESSRSEGSAPSKHRDSKLDKLFRYLCARTFCDWYYAHKSNSPASTLINFKKQCSTIPFGSVTLDHYVYFGLKGYQFAVENLERINRSGEWHGAGRPHALVFFLSDCVSFDSECRTITIDSQEFTYRTNANLYTSAGGPYFIAISLTIDAHKKIYSHSLYTRPVASLTNPIPIDSNLERDVFFKLKSQIDEMNMRLSCQKPLEPRSLKGQSGLLPDFIIQQKSSCGTRTTFRAIIEVMGMSDNPEYLNRKKRLIPLLRESWKANAILQVEDCDSVDLEDLFCG